MKTKITETTKKTEVAFATGIIRHESDKDLYALGFLVQTSYEPEDTYKDYKYFSPIHLKELRDAIDWILENTEKRG